MADTDKDKDKDKIPVPVPVPVPVPTPAVPVAGAGSLPADRLPDGSRVKREAVVKMSRGKRDRA